MFYALRYIPGIPLKDRKHAPTVGRWNTWVDAEDARLERPHPERLEVVQR